MDSTGPASESETLEVNLSVCSGMPSSLQASSGSMRQRDLFSRITITPWRRRGRFGCGGLEQNLKDQSVV